MGEGRTFGRIVRSARKAKGIGLDELVTITDGLGSRVSRRTIVRIERDECDPQISVVAVLARALELRRILRLSDLLGAPRRTSA